MHLLHVDSSILGDNSVSRKVSAAAVTKLGDTMPGLSVTYRDLDADPVPHQSGALLAARATLPDQRSPQQARDLATADAVLDEFLEADIVVIGAPMYNFGVPSQLKSWIDHLAVAGRTFRYTEAGAQGLAGGKRIVLASSRGGFYGPETPVAAFQHQESYLRSFFAFIGITEVEVLGAEGVNVSPAHKQAALENALAQAGGLTAILQAA